MTRTRASVALVASAVAAVAVIVGIGGGQSSHRRASGPFAWLQPAAPPTGWRVARLRAARRSRIRPDGDRSRPTPVRRQWRFSAMATGSTATSTRPRSRGQRRSLTGAASGRNTTVGEGDKSVHVIASSSDLTFRSGRGSCVIDDYTTSKATYREIACLVSGTKSSAVVVAAAPIALWDHQAATLERAVSSFVP